MKCFELWNLLQKNPWGGVVVKMNEPRLAEVESSKLGGGYREAYHLLAHFVCLKFSTRESEQKQGKQNKNLSIKHTHTHTFETENCSERKGLLSLVLAEKGPNPRAAGLGNESPLPWG